jgi:DNA topoisomerase-2
LKWHDRADEILVNAADNFIRDNRMNQIRIDIKQEENLISVWNNGKGIPIEIHKELNCYVPEMIFGKFLPLTDFAFRPAAHIKQL